MKRSTLWYIAISALFIVLLVGNVAYSANVNVTLRVKMSVQILMGNFNPATDSVWVAGDFTTPNWGPGPANLLTPNLGDSTYSIIYPVAEGTTIGYKFIKGTSASIGWEGDPNRGVVVGSTDTTLATVYFDRVSVYSPPVNVTFQVDMSVKYAEGSFNPGAGDIVSVTGSFNGWPNTSYTDTLVDDGSGHHIYAKTKVINGNARIFYKYLAKEGVADVWENNVVDNVGGNRYFDIAATDATIPPVYFDDDSKISTTVPSGNMLYNVDMSVMQDLGVIDRIGHFDSLRLRGDDDSWNDSDPTKSFMSRVPGTEIYQVSFPFTNWFTNDVHPYKYFIRYDTTAIAARFPYYGATTQWNGVDDYTYEHPLNTGEGNRGHVVTLGDNTADLVYFDGVHPATVIPAGDTVTVTLQYDMKPAMAFSDPFIPGVDTALLFLRNARWFTKAGFSSGNPGLMLTDPNNDSIYTVTFDMVGPNSTGLLYVLRYVHGIGGGTQDEGGGFTTRPARARYAKYIPTAGVHHFYYTFPVDTWKKNPPMAIEKPPYGIISGTPAAAIDNITVNGTTFTVHGYTWANGNAGTVAVQAIADPTGAVAPVSVAAGALATGPISADISGLTPGYSYHFSIVITTGPGAHAKGASVVIPTFSSLEKEYLYIANRWNLLSVPHYASDYSQSALFPASQGSAYYFDGSYQTTNNLAVGLGYWLKFPAAQMVSQESFTPINSLTIPVKAGWNLIGTTSGSVAPSGIAGTGIGTAWGYSNGYYQASTLTQGQGYWVKAVSDGSVSLTANDGYALKQAPVNLNSIVITDAIGNRQVLYFGANVKNIDAFEMPPVPPQGAFDVRFASGSQAISVEGKAITSAINLSSVVYPATISWDVKNDVVASLLVGDKSTVINGKGSVKVTSASEIGLKLEGGNAPKEFALNQNYPNPFNPTTKINYALAQDVHVKLAVYNVLGQVVLNLVDGAQEAGYHTVQFNATNLPSGVYFYRLEAGSFTSMKKMMLIK